MKYLVLLWISLSGFAQQPMKEAEIRAFQDGVRKLAANTETLTASFQQLKYSKYLAKPAESSGNLSFQKPSSVRWKYTVPAVYSIIFRDNKMYVQGRRKEVNKRLEKLNALIRGSVTGDMFDAPEFSFTYEKAGRKTVVRMAAREAALKRYIREIELIFEDFAVAQVTLREPSDDYTQIMLKNRVVNGRLTENIFDL